MAMTDGQGGTGSLGIIFSDIAIWNLIRDNDVFENTTMMHALEGTWRNWSLPLEGGRSGLSLQSFTRLDLAAIVEDVPSREGREAIGSAVIGALTFYEGLTGLPLLSSPIGTMAKELGWKDQSKWGQYEGLYMLLKFENIFRNWTVAASTMETSMVKGYVPPTGEQTVGSAWLAVLIHLYEESFQEIQIRDAHFLCKLGEAYKNLAAVGRKKPSKGRGGGRGREEERVKAEKKRVYSSDNDDEDNDEDEDDDEATEEEEPKGVETATGKRIKKEQQIRNSREKKARGGDYEQAVCMSHLAGLFELERAGGGIHACSYGVGKCRFRHHDSRKNAGTKPELLSMVKHSHVKDQTLRSALMEAIEAATDLYK
jgi:hypothetical protein